MDVIKCEKCLRTVGLWLFKCIYDERDDDSEILSEIKIVLNKIINCIEQYSIENEENNGKNETSYFYHYCFNNNSELNAEIQGKKRKLDECLVIKYPYCTISLINNSIDIILRILKLIRKANLKVKST